MNLAVVNSSGMHDCLWMCGLATRKDDSKGEHNSLEVLEVWPPDARLIREADCSMTGPPPTYTCGAGKQPQLSVSRCHSL